MKALKIEGEIDEFGRLRLLDAIDLTPGKVEVIILSDSESAAEESQLVNPMAQVSETQVSETQASEKVPNATEVTSFMSWLTAGLRPVASDFDADEAKWQYLKKKHNL